MPSEIITKKDLEKYRNLRDADAFIKSVFVKIKNNYAQQRLSYRLSKGYYKYYKEEYIPIFRYLKHVYGLSGSIMFKHVGTDNQSYDGVVKIDDLYKRIEIAYLYLGKYAKEKQKRIIEHGYTQSIRDSEELYLQIRKLILDTAKKKAKKPYGDTLLVLYYAFGEELYPGEPGLEREKFDELIEELRHISYHAKRVHLFIPELVYRSVSGQQTKPAKIYRIK